MMAAVAAGAASLTSAAGQAESSQLAVEPQLLAYHYQQQLMGMDPQQALAYQQQMLAYQHQLMTMSQLPVSAMPFRAAPSG